MKISTHLFSKLLTCATLLLALGSCSSGGSDGGDTTTPAQAVPTVSVTSPAASSSVPVGTVTISFTVQKHTIGNPGTSHLHFYLDTDPTANHFYGGTGINVDNGVLYNGAHTHFVHWKSNASFQIFGLPSTAHTVRLVLADKDNNELANPEATKTLNFTVEQAPIGDLDLVPVITGLNFPVGMALAPDGRVFFNERLTGAIRIIDPQWQLVPTPFCQLSVATSGEQGLLGLTLDPDFANNRFVYVYYTDPVPRNRVVRYTESNGLCTQETIILDNLPALSTHNGGIIQFGPDGKLYIIIGDATFDSGIPANAQSLTSLAGKILRVNPATGSGLSDNPFFDGSNANQDRVFSYGHRNSYGFTFHGHTGHLWETENGPEDNDEINRIIPGGNYGWGPEKLRGILNNPPNFTDLTKTIDPIAVYFPAPPCDPNTTHCVIAPTGIISIPENSTVYPAGYRNNLLFADFVEGKIRRVILSGPDLSLLGSESQAYEGGNGFLLSLMLGADGFVYVSNASGIFKVVPQ